MRLLRVNAPELELEEFQGTPPPYAILSHRWEAEEVLYADIGVNTGEKAGRNKLIQAIEQAKIDGLQYLWADTCCIDKTNSTELSEAINSMYRWYRNADVCYAYLSDVGIDVPDFQSSLWFTRGWTLQELLAPKDMVFFSYEWQSIGTKVELAETLATVTGIDRMILTGSSPIESASIAQRMSWASQRVTTRPEDVAYCLLGIFDVNMPLIYGEGEKAFIRLQEQIANESDDQSLFAWVIPANVAPTEQQSILAKSPAYFTHSGCIVACHDPLSVEPYTINKKRLKIEVRLLEPSEDRLDDSTSTDRFVEKSVTDRLRKFWSIDHFVGRPPTGRVDEDYRRNRVKEVLPGNGVYAKSPGRTLPPLAVLSCMDYRHADGRLIAIGLSKVKGVRQEYSRTDFTELFFAPCNVRLTTVLIPLTTSDVPLHRVVRPQRYSIALGNIYKGESRVKLVKLRGDRDWSAERPQREHPIEGAPDQEQISMLFRRLPLRGNLRIFSGESSPNKIALEFDIHIEPFFPNYSWGAREVFRVACGTTVDLQLGFAVRLISRWYKDEEAQEYTYSLQPWNEARGSVKMYPFFARTFPTYALEFEFLPLGSREYGYYFDLRISSRFRVWHFGGRDAINQESISIHYLLLVTTGQN